MIGSRAADIVGKPGAQAREISSSPDEVGVSVEEAFVTGSGVAPVGSSMTTVAAEDMNNLPMASATDLLRRIPQISALGTNEQARNQPGPGAGTTNATRASTVSLRGLSPRPTLVLFDGYKAADTNVRSMIGQQFSISLEKKW